MLGRSRLTNWLASATCFDRNVDCFCSQKTCFNRKFMELTGLFLHVCLSKGHIDRLILSMICKICLRQRNLANYCNSRTVALVGETRHRHVIQSQILEACSTLVQEQRYIDHLIEDDLEKVTTCFLIGKTNNQPVIDRNPGDYQNFVATGGRDSWCSSQSSWS